jgi:cold shock protein
LKAIARRPERWLSLGHATSSPLHAVESDASIDDRSPRQLLGRVDVVVDGVVKSWDDDEGWGVLASSAVPGDVFAHFSHVDGAGYRTLATGERVSFDWEPFPGGQDGYVYRATRVVRASGS